MSNIKPVYAAAAAITCTLTTLANAASRQSLVVDNTANLYLDALVSLTIKTAAGSLATTPYVDVFAYALADAAGAGPNYTDAATGTDAAFTLATNYNLKQIGRVNVNAAATNTYSPPFSVAQAFGGNLPSKWGIVVNNQTGLALDASIHSASYIGVQLQNVSFKTIRVHHAFWTDRIGRQVQAGTGGGTKPRPSACRGRCISAE